MSQELVDKAFQPLLDSRSKRRLSSRITDRKQFDVTKEGVSFKKIQNELPKGTRSVNVEYTNRKGTLVSRSVKVPMGRKKKLDR